MKTTENNRVLDLRGSVEQPIEMKAPTEDEVRLVRESLAQRRREMDSRLSPQDREMLSWFVKDAR